jgi:hypothetical protein
MPSLRCPTCDGAAEVVKFENRKDHPVAHALNMPVRFRQCANGHRFKTYEIDERALANLRREAYVAAQARAWEETLDLYKHKYANFGTKEGQTGFAKDESV